MNTNAEQTKMTAPPTDQTKMKAAEPVKMVKIKTIRAINLPSLVIGEDGKKSVVDNIIEPNQEVEVPENLAKQFCDTKFDGGYDFDGEISAKSVANHKVHIIRAVRV